MEHEHKKPHEGYIFQNKTNPDDFSSDLYIGIGRSAEEWKEVPISIYEQWKKEAEERARNETGI